MSLRRLFSQFSLNPRSTTDQAPPAYVQVPPSYPSFSGRSKVDSAMYDETEVEANPRRPNSIRLGSGQKHPSSRGATTKYLYYRLYNKDHDMPSKASFDPEDPSLGRIRVESVPPPRTTASIKRCISRVEDKPVLAFGFLYETGSSTTPMTEHIFSLVGDCPGLTQDSPLALVQTLFRIQAIRGARGDNTSFLPYTIGDILFVKSTEVYAYYEATNPAGRTGAVLAVNFKLLYD